MKGYVFFLLTVFLLATNAADWGYPDLSKDEDSLPQVLDILSPPKQENSEEGMMADQPVTEDTDDDDDDDDITTTIKLETTTADDDDDDDDDDHEFPNWGPQCENGKLQSPIALSLQTSRKAHFPNFDFDDYEDELKDARIVNNGHTVQIYKFSNKLTVKGAALPGTFVMEQMHFHWPSEHTIEKLRYPLELHIVNRNDRYNNITEAAKHPDGIAVLAVLFHASMRKNDELAQILDRVDDVADSTHINSDRHIEGIEVRKLMPKDINDEYFSYQGSLTTPHCAESVTWIVFENSLPVTMAQIEEFEQVEESDGDKIKNNYRFLQKSYNRKIIYVADDDDDGIDGIDSDNDGINDDDDEDILTNALDGDDDDDNDDGKDSATMISIPSVIAMTMTAYLVNNRPIVF